MKINKVIWSHFLFLYLIFIKKQKKNIVEHMLLRYSLCYILRVSNIKIVSIEV